MKQQSTQWVKKEAGLPEKARAMKSSLRVMLIAFFDSRGIIYSHFVPHGLTINATYYISILKQLLRMHISQKRPDYRNGPFRLQHDNGKLHMSLFSSSIKKKKEKNIPVIPHSLYSPGLALPTFFYSPHSRNSSRCVVLSYATLSYCCCNGKIIGHFKGQLWSSVWKKAKALEQVYCTPRQLYRLC